MPSILEALSLLTPYDINLPKIRIGPKGDGGYVLVDHLRSQQTVISYGISDEYSFDLEMANRGHAVHMFDHTIKPLEGLPKNIYFHSEGVCGISNPEQKLFSVKDHLDKFDIKGNDLILKMDVEGYEYEALSLTPDETLVRFEQIALEVHDMHNLDTDEFYYKFYRLFAKLNQNFTLCHVHANNTDHLQPYKFISGMPVCLLLELSFVRNDIVVRSKSKTLYPTPLDYPNVNMSDKLLWIYPFIPTSVDNSVFTECFSRNELHGEIAKLRYYLANK
jgi:hypothetical protein